MAAPAFYDLLARLRQHAEEHQRDHWCAMVAARGGVGIYDVGCL